MNEFVRGMAIFLSILSLFAIVFVKLFWTIRRRFSITVNCWFCNKNDCVPYDYRNSFICSNCEQYNGFNKDGGYNREIPEMHYTKLNKIKNCVFSEENVYALKKSNGLCDACNRDQELKILQLAAFVPDDEYTYDEEVEKYHAALEKAYRLCGKCERVLRRSLNQVKSHIVGAKMNNIHEKLQTVSLCKPTRREQITKALAYLIFVTSIFSVWLSAKDFHILKEKSLEILGPKLLGIECILQLVSYLLAVKSLTTGYILQLLDNPILQGALLYINMILETFTEQAKNFVEFKSETQHDSKELTNVLAMFANVILIVLFEGQKKTFTLYLSLFIWSSKTLLSNHEYLMKPEYSDNLRILDIFATVIVVFLSYRCLKYTNF